ncbi:MAG: carboxypeptidase-like regulatory domain-containing protein, partial [Saprospiraceae bacterium]
MGRFNICLPVLFLLLPCSIFAQGSNILKKIIPLSSRTNSLSNHVNNLLNFHDVSIAFNSSKVNVDEIITFEKRNIQLSDLITQLFYKEDIKLTISANKILVTFENDKENKISNVTYRGYIYDQITGEILVGASVVDLNSCTSTFSNEDGFYSLTIPLESLKISINYLGYKSKTIESSANTKLDVKLEFDNEIAPILINSVVGNNYVIGSGGAKIKLDDIDGFQSISGENDLVTAVRKDAGVQSGSEGQSGLYVRGGSPDQNLVLLEGIPLYEINHAAGFSSMFIEESINNVDFIKSGFPARFGGRLSSVLNVQLKEGDKSGYHGNIQLSLPGGKAHLEGPLFSKKTSFNISGRLSYLDKYINPLLGGFITYDDIDIHYNDFVGKITHSFSPTTKLSFSYYNGGDRLSLFRKINLQVDESQFNTTNNNSLAWGSKVWNVSLSDIVNDKLIFKLNAGSVSYNYNSRGTFTFESIEDNLTTYQELDVISNSNIRDYIIRLNFDYYYNDQHRFKFGSGWNFHKYNPAVRHNTKIVNGVLDSLNNNSDNILLADEYFGYVEDTYTPNNYWQIYGGAYLSGYRIGEISFNNLQPRVRVIYSPNINHRFSFSYSKMTQYVHLLINPGIGLPSDLWVPSTDKILPEHAQQFSVSYITDLSRGYELTVSGYWKKMSNL